MFVWLKKLFSYKGPPVEVVGIHDRMRKLFVYEAQEGKTDKYKAHARAYDRGLIIRGDCDDYAYTAFYAWMEWCKSMNRPDLVGAASFRLTRIASTRTYHITLEVVASDGKQWILDNRKPQPYQPGDEYHLGYDFQYRENALVSYRKAEEIR